MKLLQLQSELAQTSGILESSYNLLNSTSTASDIESVVKEKMLIRIKNLLVSTVILWDMTIELNEHPEDIPTLEAILDLIGDTEELLS